MMITTLRTLIFITLFTTLAYGQKKLLTIQDAVLKGRTSLAPKRLQGLAFIPESKQLSYIDKSTVFVLEPTKAQVIYSLSVAGLNTQLKAQKMDTLSVFDGLQWKDERSFYFKSAKQEWLYATDTKTITQSERKTNPEGLENLEEFKAGDLYAFVKENNIFVYSSGQMQQVTTDGSYEIVNGKSVHRDEFGITKGLFWSPNGNALAYYRMDQKDVTDYPIIDWTTYPAGNTNIKYPMAGNKSHYVTLHVYNIKSNTSLLIKTQGPKEQYLTNVTWSPDEKIIYMAVLNREQNHYQLNSYDAQTGEFIKTLFEEKDELYVEPQHPALFVKNNPGQFIWQSRKDGYNHLYLYASDGKLIKQLTKGTWEVKAVNGFDENRKNKPIDTRQWISHRCSELKRRCVY
jgi:dipeptidyl-peptidase 4